MTQLSILDLSPITEGSNTRASLTHSLDLAQHAERWNYTRYWVAEHHNMKGIASAATDHVARLRSYEIAAQAGAQIQREQPNV
jgi:alkanesulfonate monooxygenase SsuD/methylene tetrahydromethanopterin reductase-like flavin-dependent oxidoreductase (luciferase family)|tara:strand:- start:1063 stop:1311 length:249 start_codon:yes stop_codon:yes gene_type:complete